MNSVKTQVLVVGGGTGGTAAALQAARRGAKTLLVSEGNWLGGMLTSAGVCAPDGNELTAFQTGIWGAFIEALREREATGLDHGWVSFFTYQPQVGAQIFGDWVAQESNLEWRSGLSPTSVLREGDRITGVVFEDLTVYADIIIDGTELGDLLVLGEIPYRLGWEMKSQWNEPSAPHQPNQLTQTYPIQAPTWVFYLQDADHLCPPPFPHLSTDSNSFQQAWINYGAPKFITYGGTPNHQYMMNWPISGNDYGEGVQRLFGTAPEKQAFLQEALEHSQTFANHVLQYSGLPLQLAQNTFPGAPCEGSFAFHPYYRESRRLKGQQTVIEQDLLPQSGGQVARLPKNQAGEVNAIAIGNYANDHHYPSGDIPLAPKSMIWGGRWTGTAFCMPYNCLVPETLDGFLVCEKNQSVSHMANGATRLQPVVLGCGQAAGMAAALCIEQGIEPRQLSVRSLQNALLKDPLAPAAIIPFYNLPPSHPDWQEKQLEILDHPERYPSSGYCQDLSPIEPSACSSEVQRLQHFTGQIQASESGQFQFIPDGQQEPWQLVTLDASIHEQLMAIAQHHSPQPVKISGWPNPAGQWIRVHQLQPL